MSSKTAEGQIKLSRILTDKRKKDPVGLLRAQRNGTLHEYLSEDLAKHGLVASATPPGQSSAKPGKPSGASATPPTQRNSFKVPASSFAGATTAADATPTAKPSSRSGAFHSTSSSTQPPPPPAATVSSSTPPASRPAPGKLSASRFGSFGGGVQLQEQQQSLTRSEARGSVASRWQPGAGSSATSRVSSSAGSVSSPLDSARTWTVTPSPTPSARGFSGEEQTSESLEGSADDNEAPVEELAEQEDVSGAGAAVVEGGEKSIPIGNGKETLSLEGLAERFGGVKLLSTSGISGRGAKAGSQESFSVESGAASPVKLGNNQKSGGGSGRIAELARRFEKEKEQDKAETE